MECCLRLHNWVSIMVREYIDEFMESCLRLHNWGFYNGKRISSFQNDSGGNK